jgi:inositol phosphorylceramide mannosyltransferase catalytic subunit
VIPHTIHRIWFGPDAMPADFVRYGETWREHHPDWEMLLWTDEALPELRYPDALERCRNHGERSDLVRYELLARVGGVYVDTDMECLRPIDPLTDVPALAGETRPGKLGNAVLGAVPGHPAIEELLQRARRGVGHGHTAVSTGPLLVTEVLRDRDDVRIFPPTVFYPFHQRLQPDKDLGRSEAYTVHHMEVSWKAREDLRGDIRRLRGRLERLDHRNKKLRRDRRELRKSLERSRAARRELRAEKQWARRRVARLRRSLWWRLRGRVIRLQGRVMRLRDRVARVRGAITRGRRPNR